VLAPHAFQDVELLAKKVALEFELLNLKLFQSLYTSSTRDFFFNERGNKLEGNNGQEKQPLL